MQSDGPTTISTNDPRSHYSTLFSNCIKTKNLKLGRSLHSHLIKTSLILDTFLANRLTEFYSKCNSIDCAEKAFDDLTFKNAHSWNTMISAYSKMGRLEKAGHLLDEMPEPNLVSYNSIISSLGRCGNHKEAINVFKGMQKRSYGAVLMDEFTVVGLAKVFSSLGALELFRQVHGIAIVMGLDFNVVVCNALIDAYGTCGELDSCYKIFSRMQEKDVISWTSIVVAHARASRIEEGCRIFDQMPVRNAVSWTALITGLVQNGQGERALSLLMKMETEGVIANDVTYVSALSACADLACIRKGKQIHCRIIRTKSSVFDNVFVVNALIDMYSKCGDMVSSFSLFEGLHRKDIVSWNSIITGYAQNGQGEASLAIFQKMIQERVRPNEVTFIGVLSACSHSGLEYEGLEYLDMMKTRFGLIPRSDHYAIVVDLLGRKNRLKEALQVIQKAPHACIRKGKQIHCRIIRTKSSVFDNVFVVNALIDMYSKCGDMVSSFSLFEGLHRKDIVSWNSIITGYAQNGQGEASLAIFQKMIQERVRPNEVTFIGVLSACSHSGLEYEGLEYLDMMKTRFGLIPRSDHYAIVVDLLGRKNRLKEALQVIQKAPHGSDHIGMWGALLGTCHVHGNLELAIRAAETLFELEPENTGRYVMLSNVYATAGRYDDAYHIRSLMEDMDLKKEAGSSWIEVKNGREMFVAESMSYSKMEDVKELLVNLGKQMRDVGYIHVDNVFSTQDYGMPSSD
ncbi:hypothetical protein CDL12_28264 [Handroanthus impetiginosus]|uniref:Uncharacterized protein n=1 Tax=Handroanthus impetiginosus TaxID=429701 RepID=A0A2G9G1T8_9LAMI|nr:hypothetical protein CDL12_28264 [Handroanthus impetiginosus]